MTAPKKPQDRQPKAVNASEETEPFTFAHGGKEYSLASADTLNVGWARKHRHESDLGQLFSLLEALADDDALNAIDSMTPKEFEEFQVNLQKHNGVTVGE